ncbi:MAG: HEPN domain-containing protein [Chloroflexota bacterium]|nr:HEPN domain-containing protein [Chloroflexota bacterium]
MSPESDRIHKRYPPDDPREWLNRARSNLAQAEKGAEIGGVYFEDLCFNAQQAAEKALKALLIARQIEFPYVHDLVKLLELLEGNGQKVPAAVREAARITRYAVVTRYPGVLDLVTRREYKEALTIATAVVHWAEEIIGQGIGEESTGKS